MRVSPSNNSSRRHIERFLLLGVGFLLGQMLCHNVIMMDSFTSQLTTTSSSTTTSTTTAPVERKHGGMCPIQGCPGVKEIRTSSHVSVDIDKRNEWTRVRFPSVPEFEMMTRYNDKIISGTIRQGKPHDAHIGRIVVQQMQGQEAVLVDVGANIGYFTSMALALGARVISFEPMKSNYDCILSTVRKNNWQDRHHLYRNAVSFEGLTVNMKPTNVAVNLSNGRITQQKCQGDTSGIYGVDYMDSVSLDQVMLTKHADLKRIQLMKIDVETFEVHVINGAMRFLCNTIVEMIAMEVEYIKTKQSTVCDSTMMLSTLEKMGYATWSALPNQGGKDLTGTPINKLPTDVIFILQDREHPPIDHLKGTKDNPCEGFEI